MFTLENLKNLNTFPRKCFILMPRERKNILYVTEKHIICNQSPFMNKQLREAIMTWTGLLNKYRKDNSAGNLFAYKRQRNLCVKLLRKSKKLFYNNLHVTRITDNRKFWQIIKPNFADKTLKDETITLVDRDNFLTVLLFLKSKKRETLLIAFLLI